MFTGIVEELGQIESVDGDRVRIRSPHVLTDASIGDSIAVNGCCLTVVAFDQNVWDCDVTGESWDRTALGDLATGSPVNLERAMQMNDRLGGHIVQGHVDGVGTVRQAAPDLEIACPPGVLKYLVEKGSVTVEGISLTVVAVTDDSFTVAVIPHTLDVTTLGVRAVGDRVNLEVDVLAKYVERLMPAT